MEIIKLNEIHIKEALELIWEVFEQFESPDYSKEGIEEFKKFIEYNSMMQKIQNGEINFWGSFDKDRIAGVIAMLGENHISLLFVKKEYHRKGIAKNLVETVKEICKKQNIKSITVNSSPYAKEVYHHMDFVDMADEQITNGIRFIPMIYLLN